jgi:hypothetical protein
VFVLSVEFFSSQKIAPGRRGFFEFCGFDDFGVLGWDLLRGFRESNKGDEFFDEG